MSGPTSATTANINLPEVKPNIPAVNSISRNELLIDGVCTEEFSHERRAYSKALLAQATSLEKIGTKLCRALLTEKNTDVMTDLLHLLKRFPLEAKPFLPALCVLLTDKRAVVVTETAKVLGDLKLKAKAAFVALEAIRTFPGKKGLPLWGIYETERKTQPYSAEGDRCDREFLVTRRAFSELAYRTSHKISKLNALPPNHMASCPDEALSFVLAAILRDGDQDVQDEAFGSLTKSLSRLSPEQKCEVACALGFYLLDPNRLTEANAQDFFKSINKLKEVTWPLGPILIKKFEESSPFVQTEAAFSTIYLGCSSLMQISLCISAISMTMNDPDVRGDDRINAIQRLGQLAANQDPEVVSLAIDEIQAFIQHGSGLTDIPIEWQVEAFKSLSGVVHFRKRVMEYAYTFLDNLNAPIELRIASCNLFAEIHYPDTNMGLDDFENAKKILNSVFESDNEPAEVQNAASNALDSLSTQEMY